MQRHVVVQQAVSGQELRTAAVGADAIVAVIHAQHGAAAGLQFKVVLLCVDFTIVREKEFVEEMLPLKYKKLPMKNNGSRGIGSGVWAQQSRAAGPPKGLPAICYM